jgi:hypothetical protein
MEKIKSLWIDDLRNPEKYLSSDELVGLVWKNEAWSARKYLFTEVLNEIEILYLDNFLGDKSITGEKILSKISFKVGREGYFENLKTVYLHTSEDSILEKCLDLYTEKLNAAGIELLKAPYIRKF